MYGLYMLEDFIYKKRKNKLNYKKVYLISSISLISFKEKYDDYIFNMYLSYFFIIGRFPILSSVVFKKSENKKNRNKSVFIYLSAEYNIYNNTYALLNSNFSYIIAGVIKNKFLKNNFTENKLVTINRNFILLRFKNLSFFIIEFLNKLNGIKMVNYDRAIINYKFYVIFTAPL
jgi:hypothetical protein